MSRKTCATPPNNELKNVKAKQILEVVKDPFLVMKVDSIKPTENPNYKIKFYVSFLIWLFKHFHIGLFLVSKIRLNIFDDSKTACEVFTKCHPNNQNILCLPRSIFIATTSKRFKAHGAMFIGVFLPSKHMHAWIIEDRANPCSFDTIWTNFTPVAIMI